MTAPVNAVRSDNRTLLLGMKTLRLYNYRVTVTGDDGSCTSPNFAMMTGRLPGGVIKPTLSPTTAAGVFGGFLIAGLYASAVDGATSFIFDADGDIVWWYATGTNVSGARMSHDGGHMWINNANVPSTQGARVRRVALDGLTEENYDSDFAGMHDQLAILPDGTVGFVAYGENGCDNVKERLPDGTVRTVVGAQTAFRGDGTMCQLNGIQYSQPDDAYVVSNGRTSQIAKVKRSDGSTTWILNGGSATIAGPAWSGGNFGTHPFAADRLVIFNNNDGAPEGSIAREYALDLAAKTGIETWSYAASPAISSVVLGDVQRLPNGNTVIAYSARGRLHEVGPTGSLLQTWSWPVGQAIGYVEKRATLYGPPAR
jgi:hypothetical protein